MCINISFFSIQFSFITIKLNCTYQTSSCQHTDFRLVSLRNDGYSSNYMPFHLCSSFTFTWLTGLRPCSTRVFYSVYPWYLCLSISNFIRGRLVEGVFFRSASSMDLSIQVMSSDVCSSPILHPFFTMTCLDDDSNNCVSRQKAKQFFAHVCFFLLYHPSYIRCFFTYPYHLRLEI